MSAFLEDVFKMNELIALDKWSKRFWVENSETIKFKFAQQGYEEKGHGHIQQIITNVSELFEKYVEKLYKYNISLFHTEKIFIETIKEVFKPSLVLFCVAAHMHDIGMRFPGVFESLAEYVKDKNPRPDHIGKIIYDHHNYASFMILMALSDLKVGNNDSNEDEISRYLICTIIEESKLLGIKIENHPINHLNDLLDKIADNFICCSISTKKDFKIILAILCISHKQVKPEFLHGILKRFRKSYGDSIKRFNYWWCYFERAKKWTDKMNERFNRKKDKRDLPECDDVELIETKKGKLDLLLVEALLQYGDKTDITIARLVRKPILQAPDPKAPSGLKTLYPKNIEMPLKSFIESMRYDENIGYINTTIGQQLISDYARFRACCFIPVIMVKVNNEKEGDQLSVTIYYIRFDSDKDIFKYIRYQNEKDFYDLDFLNVIRFHIPTVFCRYMLGTTTESSFPVIEIKFKKRETHISKSDELLMGISNPCAEGLSLLKGNIKENNKSKEEYRTKKFPFTDQNVAAVSKFGKPSVKKDEKKHVFYDSCDLKVPANFEIMAILNLFHKEV